jgi:type I restriction enzyme S subunit
MESKIKNNLPTDTLKSKQNPIPRGWEIKSIKKLSKTIAGGTPSTSNDEYWGGSIMWMNSGELNLKRVYNTQGRITEIGLKNSSTKLIPRKCVLIGLAGQGKTRGTVALNEVELCTNQSIAVILPSPFFLPDYLYYNLDSRYQELRQLSTGDGGRGGLNLNIINSLKILLPPLSEQKAIAQILSKWDEAISLTQALITKKEQNKKWLMQNLLAGKKRLKGFESVKWRIQSLDNFIKPIVREIPKPNVPYLGIGLRSHGKGTFLKHDEKPEKNSMDKFYIVRPNDLIINITFAWEQAIAIVKPEDDGALASHRFPTYEFINEKGHPDFFKFIIIQPKMKYMLDQISPGGAGRNRVMSKSDFIKLELKLPDFKEQTAIAQVLQTADKEIEILKTKLELQKKQKKGLMQVLLTGKLRVKI